MPVTNYYTANGRIVGESGVNGRLDYLIDAIGSVTGTMDQSGNIHNTYRYKPSGDLLAKTGTAPDPKFLWLGTLGYRQTGLTYSDVYIRQRQYSSVQQMWTSRDPLWPNEPAYGYARAQPISRTDYYGLRDSCGDKPNRSCEPIVKSCCPHRIRCLESSSGGTSEGFLPFVRFGTQLQVMHATITITYRVDYQEQSPDCKAHTEHVTTQQSFSLHTGLKHWNVYGGWCKKNDGPTPPANAISPPMYAWTQCHPPDGTSMMIGGEGFKFRLGSFGSPNPEFRVLRCGKPVTRDRMLIHPDGNKPGTLGCQGCQSEIDATNVRSCMHWANAYGCKKIRYTVRYRGGER